MIVHFGVHLDGMQPAPPVTAVGEARLGPMRFLELLEQQLGLPAARTRAGEALLAYQGCLEDADDPSRFYHRSFHNDPLGVARTLLEWRARWYEAGWRGAFDGAVSRRLADMADVERLAVVRVPPCPGQRLLRIADALDAGLKTQIRSIVLYDSRDALPAAWRGVLERFDCATAPGVAPRAHAAPGTDLRRVQETLLALDDDGALGGGARPPAPGPSPPAPGGIRPVRSPSRQVPSASPAAPAAPAHVGQWELPLFDDAADGGAAPADGQQPAIDRGDSREAPGSGAPGRPRGAAPAGGGVSAAVLAGDSSFVVVRGVSRDLSAQAVGEYLRKTNEPDDTLVIAERDGIIVDNALERVGLPRAGFLHHSRFRAVTQVLKLALSLVWKPVGPQALLQFLLHPVGPLPGRVRAPLAEAVADEPGVGGHAWRAALDAIAAREREREPAERAVAALLDDIRYWLECERYSPADGAPAAILAERAQRCATWLARRLHAGGGETELYAAAEAQCRALIDALGLLARRGTTRVPRLVLERLVDEVTGHSADPATFAEAAHVRATTQPGAVSDTWRTVIWWDLAPQPARIAYPWSDAELAELRAQGVALPPVEELIRRRAREWARPVLNARTRLILVVHDREAGHHPLWGRLTSVVRDYNEVRVEEWLLGGALAGRDEGAGGSGTMPGLDVETLALAPRPLPAPRRWWRLPADVRIAPRDLESYSSLHKLVYHPHQWVLHYAARLAAGRAANLATGPLLYGKLAHRLFQSYFARLPDGAIGDWREHDEPSVRRWLAATLPTIVEQEGAVLEEPGMGVTRERVLATLEDALLSLLRHLRQADIVKVAAEEWHEVPFDGAAGSVLICGAIDLLLTDRRGRETVLDVKWGRQEARGREIEANRALQLATYGYMRKRAADGGAGAARWPGQAYFIVQTGNVVAGDTSVFPDAVAFEPAEPESVEDVWARLSKSYAWRRAQLERGEIEVNAAGTLPDEGSVPPADALATTEESSDRFDDFTHLTGWEPGE